MRTRRLLMTFLAGLLVWALPLGGAHGEPGKQGKGAASAKAEKRQGGKGQRGGGVGRVKHAVIPGETLQSIASRYGVKVSEIQRWNKLDGSMLRVGQTLTIQARKQARERTAVKHAVKKGETFGSIAKKYEVDVSDLVAWNRRLDPKKLRPGQTVTVYRLGPEQVSSSGGTANSGRLGGAEQLGEGPGYVVRSASRAWGTNLLVGVLRESIGRSHRKFPGAHDIVIGDLSYERGGFMAPHKSHQSGRDVDASYYIKGGIDGARFVRATPANLDVGKTWFLFEQLIATGKIQYIFVDYNLQKVLYEHAKKQGKSRAYLDQVFQYPRPRGASVGIIRWSRGHDDHWHMRVVCSGSDAGCR